MEAPPRGVPNSVMSSQECLPASIFFSQGWIRLVCHEMIPVFLTLERRGVGLAGLN